MIKHVREQPRPGPVGPGPVGPPEVLFSSPTYMFFSLLVTRKCETFCLLLLLRVRFCSSWLSPPPTPLFYLLALISLYASGWFKPKRSGSGPSVLTGPRCCCCCSDSPNPTEYSRTHRRTPVETCLGGVLETFSSNFGAALRG